MSGTWMNFEGVRIKEIRRMSAARANRKMNHSQTLTRAVKGLRLEVSFTGRVSLSGTCGVASEDDRARS